MFEKTMEAQLKRIFDLKKVTFDKASESEEQEGGFIEISEAVTRIKDGRQTARVMGVFRIFAQAEKLPYGYLSKSIDAADAADKRGFFFHTFDENRGTLVNIAERSLSFVYLFDSQYDPALGTIDEINLSYSEH